MQTPLQNQKEKKNRKKAAIHFYPLDTGSKLYIHKIFRTSSESLTQVQVTSSVRGVA